uniref:Uncharacterized protein n=1 Tax=Lotharella oceanica TaxID=641309 RepID=A0A7S2TIC4_9EUKA|mmetsp:Transcript_15450/g.29342  ORF Transcript_15450/g.29342 Transcript_15450/m.29342 type:complete len:154 (+) Transcript_15450:615-1076(+)
MLGILDERAKIASDGSVFIVDFLEKKPMLSLRLEHLFYDSLFIDSFASQRLTGPHKIFFTDPLKKNDKERFNTQASHHHHLSPISCHLYKLILFAKKQRSTTPSLTTRLSSVIMSKCKAYALFRSFNAPNIHPPLFFRPYNKTNEYANTKIKL